MRIVSHYDEKEEMNVDSLILSGYKQSTQHLSPIHLYPLLLIQHREHE